MTRTYIDIKGIVHNYSYDKDNMIQKARCEKCHRKMNNVFVNRFNKHIKIGFICFVCNRVFIDKKYLIFKINITINKNNRIKG